jgi:hypothetical protein
MPTLQRHFHNIMSREIAHDYGVMLLLGSMRAEERLATFIIESVATAWLPRLFSHSVQPAHDARRYRQLSRPQTRDCYRMFFPIPVRRTHLL